jgi:TonB family protein
METIEPSGAAYSGTGPDTEHELNFLLVRDYSGDWPRWKRAAVGSAVFHLFAITALFLIKGSSYEPPPPERLYIPHVTPLYISKELTQKAPNKGPVAKLMMAPPVVAAPKLPEPAPKKGRAAAPEPPAPAPPPPPQPAPAPVDTAKVQTPAPTPPPVTVPKPEPPKMIVEDSLQVKPPAPKPGSLAAPAPTVQEAMRAIARGGAATPRNEVGDSDDIGSGLHLNLPPSAASPRSNLQLKSDPMGVDFKPYMLQVLQAVRTNWFAVFPEAARLGMRGQVVVEFSVSKEGSVVKVVFNGQSGAKALDQAAVAAISASNPLPPLPKEFKGDRIVLQMSFMYNMPR